jgi:hypothetical protein
MSLQILLSFAHHLCSLILSLVTVGHPFHLAVFQYVVLEPLVQGNLHSIGVASPLGVVILELDSEEDIISGCFFSS